ncbi:MULTISPECIES: YjjG family noncanonical pyrimidine nucleotidase [unclassified Paenibacillus]|uniref:YjjG family noncanonical pyrimidine nucleotidase n=1 Tax=unclassified Paenibacillus TaxID=185978 RepID=UPI00240611FD|nr:MULTISPECIES: YjjG family noncanonical pyrimidine nucleotidase [unclassified Paenibacillus]MDF9842440.1 2-haloacid dehalogenase [Paenibacillus sp. PastF-2]MDF9849030.1 2-haloacid dehalogenase [Paenibacillus sp. PastM-2]MDF9855600.1 2-haloacid dehalogenase [Paenibacillus sp. PastF-1]MDH6480872.1 2-haloacid dehalogenase [Paenibacillus sp. PastH-2]MDH6508294.1 2-haloacid dehalogenase [Paenibacillus sp. PastM-3]
MKYDVILFDADDTLFDYGMAEGQAFLNVFTHFGLPAGAEEYAASYQEINHALWADLEAGRITSAALRVERFNRLFVRHKLEYNPEEFSEAYLRFLGEGTFLIQGAVELCGALEGCRLAIITNGIKDVQLSRIKGSPLAGTFEQIIISEEAGYQKPAAGIFDYAFDKLGISDKSRVLIVGDSLTSDIRGGVNYGIDTCWFNPLRKTNSAGVEPTYEIRELSELLDIVK